MPGPTYSFATPQDVQALVALVESAYRGDARLVERLLKAGARPDAANHNGATPLWLAASRGDAAVIRVLLRGGANANAEPRDPNLPVGWVAYALPGK